MVLWVVSYGLDLCGWLLNCYLVVEGGGFFDEIKMKSFDIIKLL